MSTLITTCPECGRAHEESIDATYARCPSCRHEYDIWGDDHTEEQEPDYGSAFDGHTVTSDADPGL